MRAETTARAGSASCPLDGDAHCEPCIAGAYRPRWVIATSGSRGATDGVEGNPRVRLVEFHDLRPVRGWCYRGRRLGSRHGADDKTVGNREVAHRGCRRGGSGASARTVGVQERRGLPRHLNRHSRRKLLVVATSARHGDRQRECPARRRYGGRPYGDRPVRVRSYRRLFCVRIAFVIGYGHVAGNIRIRADADDEQIPDRWRRGQRQRVAICDIRLRSGVVPHI